MARRVILHVGPHKTGTTALQQQFAENRNSLAHHGVVYPQSGVMGYGHHLFVDACRGRPAGFETVRFREETGVAQTVLISSENFVVLSRDDLSRVADFFPDAEISVVYYLRNLCDAWPSHWQEMIKHGQVLGFAEYVAQAAAGVPETGFGALNQIDQLSKLAGAFGRDAITIYGYDRVREDGQDIAAQFISQVLGVPPERLPLKSQIQNLSMKPWRIELIRILNRIHLHRTGHYPTGDLRAALLDLLDREPPDWLPRFRNLAHNQRVEPLTSSGPLVRTLQRRIVDDFGDRFCDRESVSSSYLVEREVLVPQVEIPWAVEPGLWQDLLALHARLADLVSQLRAGAAAEVSRQ